MGSLTLGETARVNRLNIKVLGATVLGTKLKVDFLGAWDGA